MKGADHIVKFATRYEARVSRSSIDQVYLAGIRSAEMSSSTWIVDHEKHLKVIC